MILEVKTPALHVGDRVFKAGRHTLARAPREALMSAPKALRAWKEAGIAELHAEDDAETESLAKAYGTEAAPAVA